LEQKPPPNRTPVKGDMGKAGAGGSLSPDAKQWDKKMRVLVCDDHTLFREGIKAILSTDPSIEIVGEAADGRQAVESALNLRPDIVVMDVSMPFMVGYEALRRIKEVENNIKILILTMYEEEEIISLCLNAGASGYILKDAPAAQFISAIHIVYEGGSYLSPLAAKKVVDHFVGGGLSAGNQI